LTGGDGNDVFFFRDALSKKNIDKITDFVVGVDRIRLDPLVFKNLNADLNDGGGINFTSGPSLKSADVDTTSFIVYDTKTGELYFDGAGVESILFAKLEMTATNTDIPATSTQAVPTSTSNYGTSTGTTAYISGSASTVYMGATQQIGQTQITVSGSKSYPILDVSCFEVLI